MSALFEDVLKERNIPYQNGVLTAGLCTFRIGAPCRRLVTPRCIGELTTAVHAAYMLGEPYAVIGGGSNVLFCDGIETVSLITTRHLDYVRQIGDGIFRVCAGVMLPRLSRLTAQAGWADLAFACGIPGTVGGGLYMNAGAYGKCLCDRVLSVRAYDPEHDRIKTYNKNKLNTSYRKTIFQGNNEIALDVTFCFAEPKPSHEILSAMAEYSAARRASQPLSQPSAGSTFRRPSPDVPLGKIFDELGLKGLSHGKAAVSQIHAGFIVNRGGATAADVLALIGEIQTITERKMGFRPETELCRIPKET